MLINRQQSPANLFFIALSDEWGTQERLILRDCRIATEVGHHVFLYCYRDSAMDFKAKRRGIKTVYHHGTLSTKLFKWHTLSQVPRLVRELDINLVHIYNIRLFWPISYFLRRKHEIPLVLTQVNQLKKFYKNIWYRPLSARLDLIMLPISEMVENIWGHLGVPPRKIEFCGLGLTPEDHKENSKLSDEVLKTENWKVACSVSGQEKNTKFLLPIFKMITVLNEKKVNERKATLFLINDKPWEKTLFYDDCRKLLKDMGLEEDVRFVDRVKMRKLQKSIDLWIGLSRKEDIEDYSVSALLMGCPVVIPRTSASMELVREHGKVGETYKKEDVRELGAKCVKVLSNVASYKNHLKRASSELEILYSYELYKRKLIELYNKVIKRRQMYARRKKRYTLGNNSRPS